MNRGEDRVRIYATLGILANFFRATTVVMLPRLIGMLFTDPAVVAGAFAL